MVISIILICLVLSSAVIAALVAYTAWLARQAERLVPPCGSFVTVDGVRLHYIDEGTGPPFLLIHGLGAQLQNFTYALTAQLAGRYRTILVDRPGCGYSDPAPQATLSSQAHLLAGLLRALNIDRALVAGHSLGGSIALALALDHPERVAGLALLAPATQPQDTPPDLVRHLAIRSDLKRRLVAWTIAAPLGVLGRVATERELFAPDPVPPPGAFATRGGAVLGARPKVFRNAARDLVEAGGQFADYAARYGTLRVPVGVLFGDGDRMLDHAIDGLRLKDQIPGVEIEIIEGGGHMTPLSSPERSAAAIDRVAARAGLLAPRAEARGAVMKACEDG